MTDISLNSLKHWPEILSVFKSKSVIIDKTAIILAIYSSCQGTGTWHQLHHGPDGRTPPPHGRSLSDGLKLDCNENPLPGTLAWERNLYERKLCKWKTNNYFYSLLQYAWRATQVQVFSYVTAGLRSPALGSAAWLVQESYVACPHAPTHDVAPRAVTMAVATDAMICTMNLNVSFFVMVN